MQFVAYITVILVGLVMNYQCLPVVESSGASQTGPAQSPEYNRKSQYEAGDIVPHPMAKGLQGRGVGMRPAYARWPGGVVPYEFASNVSLNDSIFIEKQMRTIENLTMVNNAQCVQFRPKNASDPYFITIFNGSGCSAPVGSWGNYNGIRPVSLLSGYYSTCMVSGIVQHELTHVLGFYHEQSRPDRDTYVSIQWANIDSNYVSNFDKYNDTDVDTQQTPYDYGSVMHYERNAFAINASGPTIIPTMNASAFIGQRVQLSPIDILEIQRYYGCVPTPTTTVTTSPFTSASSSLPTATIAAITTMSGTSAPSSSTSPPTATNAPVTTMSATSRTSAPSSTPSPSTTTNAPVTTMSGTSRTPAPSSSSSLPTATNAPVTSMPATSRTPTATTASSSSSTSSPSSSSSSASSQSSTSSTTTSKPSAARSTGIRNVFQSHIEIYAICLTFVLCLINSIQ